jgi:hypothetical protein
MNDALLKFLGRRIERLLYVGSILLLLSFGELYLTLVSLDVSGSRVQAIDSMLSHLTEKERDLTSLFEAQNRRKRIDAQTEEQRRVQATRKALGLAPETAPEVPDAASYALEVQKLAISAAIDNAIDVSDFEASIDFSKSPDDILKSLSAQRAAIQQQAVSVWGIEVPRTLSVEYMGGKYHVSSRFAALALLIALTLFNVAWLGSLSLTRQRELIAIYRLEDYKKAFPHIINILPVNFSWASERISRKQTRKKIRLNRTVSRIEASVFRTFVVLMISVPIFAINVYCGFKLLPFWDRESQGFALFCVWMIVSIVLLIQTLVLVAQEWVLLWGKEFNE